VAIETTSEAFKDTELGKNKAKSLQMGPQILFSLGSQKKRLPRMLSQRIKGKLKL
jgi:hypothetical protein